MSILRSIFGPSKDEIWGQISEDIGGNFEAGGFWKSGVLRYRSGEWEITLDTYTVSTGKSSVTYTRMRVPFVNQGSLRFKIYREGFFTSIMKTFGMQDIEVGDTFFDTNFVIQANNEDKIRLLLNDPKLKELIAKQPSISFEIKDDEGWFGTRFPEGVDELYFQCYGVLKDEDLLKNLFEMFSITLQRLVQTDSAYENDPGIRL